MSTAFTAIIDYDDEYVQSLLCETINTHLPSESFKLIDAGVKIAADNGPTLQFRSYETIDFELGLVNQHVLSNAYVIRKALIRKHFLSNTILNWVTKHPTSLLKSSFKATVDFELDYAEFLDEALLEAYELTDSFKENEEKPPSERQWWILKPGMSDRGQGIRLFSTEDQLVRIFEEWENEQSDGSDDDDEEATEGAGMISQLRHFVAQPYIYPPLLMASSPASRRKFHIRTYVVASGALRVYVYQPMLALFASKEYKPPWDCVDDEEEMRNRTLTNTCVQTSVGPEGSNSTAQDSVHLFQRLAMAEEQQSSILSQINAIAAELFQAALGQPTNFQPLPNSFEMFGLDFLVDVDSHVWLLEVNAFPDFAQTGTELRDTVVKGLFEELFTCIIGPFFGIQPAKATDGSERLVKVLDVNLHRNN